MPGRITFHTRPDGAGQSMQERIRIDSDGQVQIGSGTIHGGGHLTIRGGGVNTYACQDYQYVGTPSDDDAIAQIRFTANTTGGSVVQGAKIQAVADADWGASGDAPTRLEFHTAPNGSATMAERLRITELGDIYAGNADVGGYPIFDNSTTNPRYQFRQGTGTYRGFALIETRGDANSMALYIAKSREGPGTGVINSGDQLGSIQFTGADGTNQVTGAQILAYTSGTIAADRIPTNLSFYTHPDSTAGKQQRLRINSEGQIIKIQDPVNRTSLKTYSGEGLHFDHYQLQVGSTYRRYADIAAVGDGSWGGILRFHTMPDGGSATERLRITEDGNLGLGIDSPVARFHVHNSGTGSGDHAYAYFTTGDTGATTSDGLTIGVAANLVATINYRESGTLSFGTSSSSRLEIDSSGNTIPGSNNSYNLGSSSRRWANVYTNDLHLSNQGSTNSVDNTWGDFTIQEGETDLYLINNRSGKKYKFNLTEVS